MSKKKRKKDKLQKSSQNSEIFIKKHWDKFVIILLLLLPLIYFGQFLNSNKMIAGSDYLLGGYPFEKWITDQEQMPLWYPHVFGGVPVLGAPVGGPLAPLAQLRAIMPPHVVLALSFIFFFFLAGLGTYLYLKEIGLSQYSAAVGAFVYQFIGNLATTPMAGHTGRAASVAMFPLLIFFIARGLRTKKLLFFLLFSVAAAFTFYEGHFQITYYGLLFILGYAIYYLIRQRKEIHKKGYFKIISYGVIAVLVICLLMAGVWLPVLSGLGTVARGVERGYEYAISWAMPPLELIDLVIPGYSGLLNNYWGFNSFKIHLEYFGLCALVLGLLTIILLWKKRYVKFYTIGAFIALLIALGGSTPVFAIFYQIIPGFKLTRAPALIFYLVSFSFVVLGSLGFEALIVNNRTKEDKNLKKRFLVISGIFLGILLITALVCSAGASGIVKSMQQTFGPRLINQWGSRLAQTKISLIAQNFSNFVTGIWRSLTVMFFILLILFLGLGKKLKVWLITLILVIITLIDQVPLTAKFLPVGPAPEKYYAADNIVNFLKKDNNIFRVFPTLYYPHSRDLYLLYHNIQSAGGYIPNPIQRYQEFIGAGKSVMFTPQHLFVWNEQGIAVNNYAYNFLNMLNIKYVIGPTLPEDVSHFEPQLRKTINSLKTYFSKFTIVHKGSRYSVYRNDRVLPRAYFVSNYKILDASQIMEFLKSSDFSPSELVVLEPESNLTDHIEEDKQLFIPAKIVKYSANEVICQVNAPNDGILVLDDNWHPDWKAFVDGKVEEIFRANYTFRAVYISKGSHTVIFKYISSAFNFGSIISVIAFFMSVICGAAALKFHF